MNRKKFPIKIFPDIKNENKEFPKYKKKNISEDFVAENFKNDGWTVYTPYVDTGIDMIITKKMKNSHGSLINATRFIQVKTRALKKPSKNGNPYMGYTLKTKDFREDPREVFLFYNDNPTFNGHCDFFIVPMYQFMKFFYHNSYYNHNRDGHGHMGESQFSSVTFRQENGKMNGLHYNMKTHHWKYSGHNFEQFKNNNGLALIDSLDIENNYKLYHQRICNMKNKLYYHNKNISKAYKTGSHITSENQHLYHNFIKLLTENDNNRMNRFKKVYNHVNHVVSHKELISSKKYNQPNRKP